MTNDLDRDLIRVFAAASVPLPAGDFIRRLQLQVALRRRLRSALRLAAILSLFFVGAFAAHALVRASLLATERFGELLISPLGWTLSLLLAIVVVRRRRLLRG
jgi:hypothetical protein